MSNVSPFPAAKIQPPQSSTDVALAELNATVTDLKGEIAHAQTVADAYALWRHFRELERLLMELTELAAAKLNALEVSDMERGAGLQ